MRQRFGLIATIAGGAVLMVAAGMCYLAGHTGVWIGVQLLSGVGLAAVGASLLKWA